MITNFTDQVIELRTMYINSKEQNKVYEQRIENQRTQLKNLNTKSNLVVKLNKEVTKLRTQLEAKTKIIQKMRKTRDSSQECTICCEVFSKDRKKIAFAPCGHSIVCVECSKEMKRNTRWGKKNECPICRSEIKLTLTLEGIYWTVVFVQYYCKPKTFEWMLERLK